MSSWPSPFKMFNEDPKIQREPMADFSCWKRGLVREAGRWGSHPSAALPCPVALDLSFLGLFPRCRVIGVCGECILGALSC